MRKRGRPTKVRINKKVRTKLFGNAVKGAKTPAQIRAAIKREIVRPRKSWRNSNFKKGRYA